VSRSPTNTMHASHCGRSPRQSDGLPRPSAASCAATAPAPDGITHSRPTKLAAHPHLFAAAKDLLAQRWSPAQISRALSRETIHQELYRPKSLLLRRPAPSPLRTGRDHKSVSAQLAANDGR
jgi:hypothetical protein